MANVLHFEKFLIAIYKILKPFFGYKNFLGCRQNVNFHEFDKKGLLEEIR
jgi:hypothetical protein